MLMKLYINGIWQLVLRISILLDLNLLKAKHIADVLGKPEFKGSNGWLTKWKNRYNIKKVRICGESGDVHGETVQSWKERLPEILRGYSKEDIWNIDDFGEHYQKLDLGRKEGMQRWEEE